MKKFNLNPDKSQWNCWEIQIRTEPHDLFVTVIRRKFIPPLMEIFQDIIIISTFDYKDANKGGENLGEFLKPDPFLE